jgi:hypothetical protein
LNSAILYETAAGSYVMPEKRLTLIHRVIVPDRDYPKEYGVLVTDRRSVFIRQKKTRSGFVLRGEMRYGTALVTDVQPKTLEDYEGTNVESLAADSSNIAIPHDSVTSLVMTEGEPKFRLQDLWVWLTMKRQGHEFHVYDFEMSYADGANHETRLRFYAVPLGVYFKPRRQTQTRKTILRDYALDVLQTFRKVLPAEIITG